MSVFNSGVRVVVLVEIVRITVILRTGVRCLGDDLIIHLFFAPKLVEVVFSHVLAFVIG